MPANLRVALSRDTRIRVDIYIRFALGAIYIKAVMDGGTGLKSHQHAASALRLWFQVLTTRFTVFKYTYRWYTPYAYKYQNRIIVMNAFHVFEFLLKIEIYTRGLYVYIYLYRCIILYLMSPLQWLFFVANDSQRRNDFFFFFIASFFPFYYDCVANN